jgi:hypothetical protein
MRNCRLGAAMGLAGSLIASEFRQMRCIMSGNSDDQTKGNVIAHRVFPRRNSLLRQEVRRN